MASSSGVTVSLTVSSTFLTVSSAGVPVDGLRRGSAGVVVPSPPCSTVPPSDVVEPAAGRAAVRPAGAAARGRAGRLGLAPRVPAETTESPK